MRTLYLCYFGLWEPLVQTQVLPYLRELVKGGIEVHLLTFEPAMRTRWDAAALEAARAALAADGIEWHARPYHKKPSLPATLYDILQGAWFAGRLARQNRIGVYHARSHVAAAMGALARRITGGKLIFDIRGFMPEEYADAGVWPAGGWLFRGMKAVERRLFEAADAFVVLTDKARDILFPGCLDADERGRPFEVIPCCIDARRFADIKPRDEIRRELGLEGRWVIVYVGSFGGWYLTEETIAFFASARRRDPSAFAMVLTQSDAGDVARRLRNAGLADGDFSVRNAAPADVPRYLNAADLALSFIKPGYSKQASSPTKIAEYLISGLPVVSNAGIGDLDALIERENVGRIVREFSEAGYTRVLAEMDELKRDDGLRGRCQRVARSHFDLEGVGGPRYRRLYVRLMEGMRDV
jgi:glycosyltransferase involved in cell wall biosynthesis